MVAWAIGLVAGVLRAWCPGTLALLLVQVVHMPPRM